MAGFRFGLSFLDYVPSIVGTAVADRPVTNVELYLYQLRTWRSATTSAADSRIILDLGTAKTVRHVVLENCNFSSVLIEVAANSAFTGSTSHGSFVVNQHRRTGRRNVWITIVSPLSRQFLRITPSTIVGALTVYEVGVVAVFDGITELVDSPGWPNQYVRRQAQTRTAFASGGEDVSEDGVPFLELTIAKDHWKRTGSTVQAQLFDILDAGVAGPICYFENLTDTSAVYMTRRVNDVEFQERHVIFDTSITFREAI